jgi:hypothetical protein
MSNLTPDEPSRTIPDTIAERINTQRDQIFEAAALIDVVFESPNQDDELSRRSVLKRAYSMLQEAAGMLDPGSLVLQKEPS